MRVDGEGVSKVKENLFMEKWGKKAKKKKKKLWLCFSCRIVNKCRCSIYAVVSFKKRALEKLITCQSL